ncbi:MAG: hypothetical protein WBC19_04325 [Pyrinomonadaceae bacterium]
MKNAFGLTLSLLLLVVIGCSCPSKLAELGKKKETTTPPPSATPYSPSSTPVSKGANDVSMDKYEKIKIGTSRSDVENILGGKGTEISSSVGGGVRFSVNKWEGERYKSIILSFKNDKVMSKSQVGLK